jgi:hypothetical protein
MIENAFEIQTKSTFVPIGEKHFAPFIDDLNMASRDLFESQSLLELIHSRVKVCFKQWF